MKNEKTGNFFLFGMEIPKKINKSSWKLPIGPGGNACQLINLLSATQEQRKAPRLSFFSSSTEEISSFSRQI